MDEEDIDTVSGKVCSRKQRRRRRKNLMREQLQDFARNTTLHGLRYVAERGSSRVEKIFWLTLFLISVGICALQIRTLWIKRETSPVIVSISERLVPVSEVLFPSITVCPQWKISKFYYKYDDVRERIVTASNRKEFENITLEERMKFEDVSLICDSVYLPDIELLNRTYSNDELVRSIIKAQYSQFIFLCSWGQNKAMGCSKLFKKVLTEEGVCYNFNSMAAEKIFHTDKIQSNYSYIESGKLPESDSTSDEESNSYAEGFKGQYNGSTPDLTLMFDYNKFYMDKKCNPLYAGYKVYVDSPWDMPQSSLNYFSVLSEESSLFGLKFSIMTTQEDLKEYSPEQRQCFFPEERSLQYFKVYTENNCRLECVSNHTYEKCGCVGFYMPHNTSDRLCTIKRKNCMKAAISDIASTSFCNCLPPCNTVQYDADVLKSEYNLKQYWIEHPPMLGNLPLSVRGHTFSRLEMYFKRPRYVAMRRSALFGRTDFIASCGGLLGLFLGFSFISLVEIFYFFTLRIWCVFKRDSNEENEKRIQHIEKNR